MKFEVWLQKRANRFVDWTHTQTAASVVAILQC